MSASDSEKTIKLKTSRFGDFEVRTETIIQVVSGVIGFPNEERFVLLDYNPPFSWLQSIDNPDLAFVVVNAAEFGENYQFQLPIGDPNTDLKEDDEVAIMNLVSVRPPPLDTTVNLKAPVIVNLRTMKGVQVVIDDPRLSTRFPLFEKDGAEQGDPKK